MSSKLNILLVTLGVAIVMENLALLAFKSDTRTIETSYTLATVAIGPAMIALPLLAMRRARFQRHTAGAAVAGVVASMALSVALIFFLGVQPPNNAALKITLAFLALTAVVWFGFERRRFKGPPVGDEVSKRQAQIAAAEKALTAAS